MMDVDPEQPLPRSEYQKQKESSSSSSSSSSSLEQGNTNPQSTAFLTQYAEELVSPLVGAECQLGTLMVLLLCTCILVGLLNRHYSSENEEDPTTTTTAILQNVTDTWTSSTTNSTNSSTLSSSSAFPWPTTTNDNFSYSCGSTTPNTTTAFVNDDTIISRHTERQKKKTPTHGESRGRIHTHTHAQQTLEVIPVTKIHFCGVWELPNEVYACALVIMKNKSTILLWWLLA
jgi:hypothetical protein